MPFSSKPQKHEKNRVAMHVKQSKHKYPTQEDAGKAHNDPMMNPGSIAQPMLSHGRIQENAGKKMLAYTGFAIENPEHNFDRI